jgi:fibronectin type 3 domain-containing protein
LVLPAAVKEFQLAQEGEGLLLSWRFPTENQLGQPLTQLSGFRLERCEMQEPAQALGCLVDFALAADIELDYPKAGVVRGGEVYYHDKKLLPGRRYYYRVAAYDQSRLPGVWSKVLSRAWVVLPQAPRDFNAEAGDRVVALAWSPVTHLKDGSPARDLAGYHVYRRGKEGDWTRLTPGVATGMDFQDVAVKNAGEYTYTVRAVRKIGKDLLESGNSAARTVMPEDFTAPAPLLNLVAAPTAKGIELRWDDSPAKDLAGYRVYRRQAGEAAFTRLTPDLLKKPYYVDAQASRGQTYYYYVTAVDDSRRANESLPSEETAVNF